MSTPRLTRGSGPGFGASPVTKSPGTTAAQGLAGLLDSLWDAAKLPTQLQVNQYGLLALVTLLSLSHASGDSSAMGLGPYQMALVAFAMWYGPSVLKDDVLPQKYAPLAILVAMMSLYGPWRLPLGDFAQPYHLHSVLLAGLVHYAPAIFQDHFLTSRNKYILLGLAFLIGPSSTGHGILFEPYLQWILAAATLFFTIASSSTNLFGPLLWAYPQRESLFKQAEGLIPTWGRFPSFILVFHPWTRWWIIPFLLASGWQYLRFDHASASRGLLTRARAVVAGASGHASRMQTEAKALHRLSIEAHAIAAAIGRDALAAHHVRLTDFHAESARAWAKLDEFRTAADKAADQSNKLFPRVRELQTNISKVQQSSSSSTLQMAKAVYEESKSIAREANDFRTDVMEIQAKTDRFARAARWADNGRAAHADATSKATQSAKAIAELAAGAWETARNTEGMAEMLKDELTKLEDEIAAGKKAEAESIVQEMEKKRPPKLTAVSGAGTLSMDPFAVVRPTVPTVMSITGAPVEKSNLEKAEIEIAKLYAFELPTNLLQCAEPESVYGAGHGGDEPDY
ncbi:hypothetical protein GP486_000017 [Trichoglossum hirsutum]|uniref:Uncharacterized protein n=1 Tax=Trichoglossum hirsutum TaxID=265104 RepID=A0A9P8LJA4_9PEZI|nr:hypothetical protein GP486_000017 [Trichoglossum hirsutum]